MTSHNVVVQVLALMRAMRHQPNRPEWVMWMDCDSFFMNFSVSPLDLVATAEAAASTPPVDAIYSEDGVMINTGALIR